MVAEGGVCRTAATPAGTGHIETHAYCMNACIVTYHVKTMLFCDGIEPITALTPHSDCDTQPRRRRDRAQCDTQARTAVARTFMHSHDKARSRTRAAPTTRSDRDVQPRRRDHAQCDTHARTAVACTSAHAHAKVRSRTHTSTQASAHVRTRARNRTRVQARGALYMCIAFPVSPRDVFPLSPDVRPPGDFGPHRPHPIHDTIYTPTT